MIEFGQLVFFFIFFYFFFIFFFYGLLVILVGGGLHVSMDDRVGFGGGGLGCSGFLFFVLLFSFFLQ